MLRRLPCYLLVDTSGSMKGEPIEAVRVGINTMLSTLRQDPYALETLHLSIITFDKDVKQALPLTSLEVIELPELVPPESGPTHLGQALELLCRMVDAELIKNTSSQKGDWRPLLFILTDGKPSDHQKLRQMIPEVKKRQFASVVSCAAGPKARINELKDLSDHVVTLDTADSTTFSPFFEWVSSTLSSGNMSQGTSKTFELPPPPPEVNVVM